MSMARVSAARMSMNRASMGRVSAGGYQVGQLEQLGVLFKWCAVQAALQGSAGVDVLCSECEL